MVKIQKILIILKRIEKMITESKKELEDNEVESYEAIRDCLDIIEGNNRRERSDYIQ